MSRRKRLTIREPNGRPQRACHTELMSPTAIHRLTEAASAEMRHQLLGSQVGRLHLTGKLTAGQLAAAKRWLELNSDYASACLAPCPPRTKPLDATGGTPIDPDSEKGRREAKRHERAAAAWIEGRHALRLAGPAAEAAVDSVCVQDCMPAGWSELEALRTGLQALSAWWTGKRKATGR